MKQVEDMQASVSEARDRLERELHQESLHMKQQRLNLMRVIEDLTLQLKEAQVDQASLDQAREIAREYEEVRKELKVTKRGLDALGKQLKAAETQAKKQEEANLALRGENDKLKKMILELDSDCDAKGF